MLEQREVLDICSVRIDPKKAQLELPAELSLSLDTDGTITLGPHVICRCSDGGQAEYEKIRRAFETGNYTLKISPSGITLETEDDRVTDETRRSLARLSPIF